MEPGKEQTQKQKNVPVEVSDSSSYCKGTTKTNLVSKAEKEFIFQRIMDAKRPRPVQIAILKPDPSQGSRSGSANLSDEEAGEEADDEYAQKAKEITRLIRERFCREGLSLPSKSAGNGGSESEEGLSKLSERLKMVFRMSEDVGPVGKGSTIEDTVANSPSEPEPDNILKDSKPEEPQTGPSCGHVVPSDSLVTGIQNHAIAEDSDESGDPNPDGVDRTVADLLGVIEEVVEEMRKSSVTGSKLRGEGVCHLLGYEEEEETEWSEGLLLICMELQEFLLDELLEEAIGLYER